MQITVQLFASLAKRLETRTLTLTLPENTTVEQLLDTLTQTYPAFAPLRQVVAVAVNMAYVSHDTLLTAQDEIALIPPVSGG